MKNLKNIFAMPLFLACLPILLQWGGLTYTSAVECLLLALAGLGLNLLFGYTGLVSFGHAAWFGIGAYGVAIFQLRYFKDGLFMPILLSTLVLIVASLMLGALILRRRGVYFSLLTLAFSALCFTIAFRWTALTGGENGLGGINRSSIFGFSLDQGLNFYIWIAVLFWFATWALRRIISSPFGLVLVGIRENEQRMRFLGFNPSVYKLIAFVLSASITGFAGALSVLNHRIASAESLSVAFSGELLALVIIGGMRSYIGPIIGALFFVLFREYLSIYTENWLLYFGLVFILFIIFSPEGLAKIFARIRTLLFKEQSLNAAMSARSVGAEIQPIPSFLKKGAPLNLNAEHVYKNFGGITAVKNVSVQIKGKGLHALIGPNGAGKTSFFNLLSGMFAADQGVITYGGNLLPPANPNRICLQGVARSFQITNLFKELSVYDNLRLSLLAKDDKRLNMFSHIDSLSELTSKTNDLVTYLGVRGMEGALAEDLSYGGQRLVDMGLALGSSPGILLLDEPLAGLSVNERTRIGNMIRQLADEIGVLLVEHDIDRVLEIANEVTVMNMGEVLINAAPEQIRLDERVREIYIGSGVSSLVAMVKPSEHLGEEVLRLSKVNVFYGKSHILHDIDFSIRKGETIAVLGRNGAGKSTLMKSLVGLAQIGSGDVFVNGQEISQVQTEQMAKRGIAYVPQGRRLFSGMTVRDNLMLGRLKRSGMSSGGCWTDEQIFELFPRIAERMDSNAEQLSGGEQQMVAIARALVGEVKILLLDEPFEGLSPVMAEVVFKAILKIRESMAVMIVDHNLDLALAVSNKALVLDRGRISHYGEAKPLLEDLDFRQEKLWI